MGDNTGIEWTDATWNPIVGCSVVSAGCTNCYAMKQARRIELMTRARSGSLESHYSGTVRVVNMKPVWTGKVALAPEQIFTIPLRCKRPRKIFVNSMGDLFHESVPDEWIDRVFAVMALSPQHTFQVLTKRSQRMREYFNDQRPFRVGSDALIVGRNILDGHPAFDRQRWKPSVIKGCARPAKWPLPNVWLGVSAERQQEADERVPDLLATPAAIRFASAEPLIAPIDFAPEADDLYQRLSELYEATGFDPAGSQPRQTRRRGWLPRLDWIIAGAESGPGARPMHPEWARSIRDQCAAAGVPFFFKQWGDWKPISQIDDVDALYDPAPAGHPEAIRRCRFEYEVMHSTGQRFGHLDRGAFVSGSDAMTMFRVGKRAAGSLLDGVEHKFFPATGSIREGDAA